MSKDFEQAYRELAENEMPDLWDRIEAGLERKSTPEQIKESGTEKTTEQEVTGKTAPGKQRHRKIKAVHINRYSGIAAAAVCVAVIIPAAVFLLRSGNKSIGNGYSGGAKVTEGIDTAAAEDEVLEFAADEAESCEAAAEEMDAGAGALNETAGELAEKREEGDQARSQDNAQDSAEDKAMAEMAQASQMQDEADDLKKESKENGEEGAGALTEATTEGTVFEHVEIRVMESENDFEREDGSSPGVLYTVTVQKDASGRLKEGEELVVDLPAYSSYALDEDGVFEVDLVYKGNGTYGLEGFHQRIEE